MLTVPAEHALYHTAIIGQSGSGKSFAIARILEELTLRTRVRLIILDPNGDFSRFYLPDGGVWHDSKLSTGLSKISTHMPAGMPNYDTEPEFAAKWNSRRFQFVSADQKNWTPFRQGANAAPLKIHWKFLDGERDFLLSVDPTHHPKIHQGIVSCYHYVDQNEEQYQQGYSLEDLEQIAQDFALKRIAMGDYPDAQSLDEVDWLAVRLQFRQLRKRFFRLWSQGALKEQESAPNDLSSYIRNGFRQQEQWQVAVVGLAGLNSDHMHLAANTALYQAWFQSVRAWQEARARSHMSPSQVDGPDVPDSERAEPASDRSAADQIVVPMDRRVPTFIVIDEAHNFAPEEPASPLQARVSDKIASIAAEGRKYGLFLIIATQRPQKLRRGLLAECENSCLLRIQSKIERAFAAEALGVPSETVDQVKQFDTGQALMIGRWVAGTPSCNFASSRTMLGGGGIGRDYWTAGSR